MKWSNARTDCNGSSRCFDHVQTNVSLCVRLFLHTRSNLHLLSFPSFHFLCVCPSPFVCVGWSQLHTHTAQANYNVIMQPLSDNGAAALDIDILLLSLSVLWQNELERSTLCNALRAVAICYSNWHSTHTPNGLCSQIRLTPGLQSIVAQTRQFAH